MWLKVVAPFLAHEGVVLADLQSTGLVPVLVARGSGRDGTGRVLLADVRGEDQYGADADRVAGFAEALAALQLRTLGHSDALVAAGVPDRRDAGALVVDATRLLGLLESEVDPYVVDVAHRLVDAVPAGLDRARAEGLSDTLVHGDFHAGNVRGVPGAYRVLDWGDAYVGQPAVDLATATDGLDVAGRAQVVAAARRVWGPDVELARAVHAVRPRAWLRTALQWQLFLDRIEPDERPYHEGDPASGLRQAVTAYRDTVH